jgi:5-oxoprolinase (ATP-hydrolysing) subunit A
MACVDLNSDLGESFGAYTVGCDDQVLQYITSANIACGFHAGDPTVMKKTVRLALANGVALGAHPGLQDLKGFGRRKMDITGEEAYDITLYQISALYGIIKAEGGVMHHVKPHGALYNMAAKDPALARGIAEAVYKLDPDLILFGLAGSELIKAGKEAGLRTASEVFADRTYQPDGGLTPRSQPGAMITDEEQSLAQVLRMVQEGTVQTLAGTEIPVQADTICVHGDGPKALAFTSRIRAALQQQGIEVRPV